MIYVVVFILAVATLGGPLHRVLLRLRRPTVAEPEPGAPVPPAVDRPMRERPRAVDAMGPWRAEEPDGLEFRALLAEVMAATREPSGSL